MKTNIISESARLSGIKINEGVDIDRMKTDIRNKVNEVINFLRSVSDQPTMLIAMQYFRDEMIARCKVIENQSK